MLSLSPDDFEAETNFEEGDDNDAMYSSDVISYGHGPPLDTDDIYELPMLRCDCKKNISSIAGRFLNRMQQRQKETVSRKELTGRREKRMTIEEFSEAARAELEALDPPVAWIKECCRDAVRVEVGTITEADEPLSRVVRAATAGDKQSGFFEIEAPENCQVCRRNLETILKIKRKDPKMPWEDVSRILPGQSRLRACCRINIMEPITMSWNLERARRIIAADKRSTVPLEGQRLIEGRTLQDDYYGNVTIRKVSQITDPAGDPHLLRKYNPYTYGQALLDIFNIDPDSSPGDDRLIILPPKAGDVKRDEDPGREEDERHRDNTGRDYVARSVAAVKSLTAAVIPRAPRWAALYQIDESLFPVMPSIDSGFAFQPVEYSVGLNLMEQNYRIVGMMRTGLEGYETPITTAGYSVR